MKFDFVFLLLISLCTSLRSLLAKAIECDNLEKTSLTTNNFQSYSYRLTMVPKNQLVKHSLALWGVLQVVSIFAQALKRLIPIALIPFYKQDLSTSQWLLYSLSCLAMGYFEGYKSFHKKFSPFVVFRAFNLSDNPSLYNYLLAGPYCMGMFSAPKKKVIASWSITVGVYSLTKLVHYLPYPYRSILDGGVVVGLSYGIISMLIFTAKAFITGNAQNPDETLKKDV